MTQINPRVSGLLLAMPVDRKPPGRTGPKVLLAIHISVLGFFCLSCLPAWSEPVVIDMWGLVESRMFHGTFRAIDEFERLHPNIRIRVGTPGGQGDLDPQKLLTAVVGKTPPDVVWFGRHNMGMWAPRGAFRNLNDLIKRDGIDMNEYYPGTVQEVSWDGGVYAMPWNVDCRVLFCNMDILRQGGFTQPPTTWDELQKVSAALTHYDEKMGRYSTLGFAPNYGNAWLYLYGWQNGAEWVSLDGRKAMFNDLKIRQALEWMVATYDTVGGAEKVAAFQNSAQMEGIGEPFMSGRLAMQINANYFLDYIARLKPDMDFAVAPPPMPETGMAPVSWSGGFSWVIPKDAAHVEEAWEFIKWINSEEAWIITSEAQREFARQQWGERSHFVPLCSSNRIITEHLVARYTPDLPENFAHANQVCLDLLPNCKFRPVSPACNELWDGQDRAATDAIFHVRTPAQTLELQQRRVQSALDRFFATGRGTIVSTQKLLVIVIVLIILIVITAIVAFFRGLSGYEGLSRRRAMQGVALVSPWLVGFVLLILGPMLFSALLAFTDYDVIHPPEWSPTGNWTRMFGIIQGPEGWTFNDPQFWKGLWNTAYITLFGVPFGLAVSLLLAMLLNTDIRGIPAYRTLFYVPVMVPGVVVALIWMWMLNPETGFANYGLRYILAPLGLSPPNWFGQPEWAKPGLILLTTWGCGGTIIVWLAGLHTLPRHLYEAAMIDGAGACRRFWNITLPLLTPYILFLWIMGTIGSLQIFTQAYIIQSPGDSMLFYVLYLFFRAFRYFEMGYACAMAWVLFAITVTICLWQMRISRRWVHYETEL